MSIATAHHLDPITPTQPSKLCPLPRPTTPTWSTSTTPSPTYSRLTPIAPLKVPEGLALLRAWNQNSVIHSQWGRPRKGSHLTKVILSSPVRTDRKEKEGVGTTISSLYLLRSGRATLSLLDQDQEPYRFFLHWVGYIYTSLYSITESPLTTHGMLFHAYKNHRQAGHHPCCLLGDETIHLPWFI